MVWEEDARTRAQTIRISAKTIFLVPLTCRLCNTWNFWNFYYVLYTKLFRHRGKGKCRHAWTSGVLLLVLQHLRHCPGSGKLGDHKKRTFERPIAKISNLGFRYLNPYYGCRRPWPRYPPRPPPPPPAKPALRSGAIAS